jgi:hypothetical protein
MFFLKVRRASAAFVFPVRVSVRNGVPATWGKLLLLSARPVRPECNKTYAIVFKRTERVGSF